MTDAEQLVDEISGLFENAPKLHELEEDEAVKLGMKWHEGGMVDGGISFSFHFGSNPSELHEEIHNIVEPKLDKRKFRMAEDRRQGKSWSIGTITVDSEGNIVDYAIEEEYLKPSENE